MSSKFSSFADRLFLDLESHAFGRRIATAGRAIGLAGVVLPLFLIGVLKFTQYEVEALRPLITATPWLSWLHLVFGETVTTALLGVVEIATAALLIASIRSPAAGIVGGAIAALTFVTTVSIMLAVPIWEDTIGGFPWLNATGQFLLKDVALLGISLVVLGESLTRLNSHGKIPLE